MYQTNKQIFKVLFTL